MNATGFAERKFFKPGDVIIREGDDATWFYIVETGKVEVYRMVDGKKAILGHIGANGIFGEMAIIDKGKRLASVAAVEPTTCRVFNHAYLEQRIQKSDLIVQAMLKIFIDHIRALNDLQARQALEINRLSLSADDVRKVSG